MVKRSDCTWCPVLLVGWGTSTHDPWLCPLKQHKPFHLHLWHDAFSRTILSKKEMDEDFDSSSLFHILLRSPKLLDLSNLIFFVYKVLYGRMEKRKKEVGRIMGRKVEKEVPLTRHWVPAPCQDKVLLTWPVRELLCSVTFHKCLHQDLSKVTPLLTLSYSFSPPFCIPFSMFQKL